MLRTADNRKNYYKKKIDSIFHKNTFLILLKIIDKLYGRCYKKLLNICNKNIFSIMEEIWASDTKKIDLVVFWNEFVIISFEIKSNFVCQNYQAVGYILFCAKKWRSERKRKKPKPTYFDKLYKVTEKICEYFETAAEVFI